MPLRWILLFSFGLILTATSGCGSSDPLGRRPVSGTVKLNGAPLASGSIEFAPVAAGGVQTGALIDAGNYSIPREQGLPPGGYRVSIVDSPPAPPLPPGHMPGDPLPPAPKPQVPAEWNTKSQKTVTVPAQGAARFDFEIQTKK